MEQLLLLLAPLMIKYGPQLASELLAALKRAGYTVTQIDDIFAQCKPYESLDIHPPANPPATLKNV